MTPQEADYVLQEWARWQREGHLETDWPTATPFGRQIKPDPRPAQEPIDEDRAMRTDRVLARLPRRYRFLVRLYYLDFAPIDAKARRMRMGRRSYLMLLEGVQRVVAARLDQTQKPARFMHAARVD